MGRIKVQASQSQMAWQPLPRGTYNFQIDKVEEKTSSNNNPQLVFSMSVVDGEYAGKKAMHFMTISEKSGGFVKEMIEATGIDHEVEEGALNEEDGKPFLIFDFDSDDFVGKYITCDATISTYNDKENNKFSKFRPFGDEQAAAPEEAEEPAPEEAEEPAPARAAAASKPAAGAKPAAAASKSAAKPAAQQGRAAAPAGNAQRRQRV